MRLNFLLFVFSFFSLINSIEGQAKFAQICPTISLNEPNIELEAHFTRYDLCQMDARALQNYTADRHESAIELTLPNVGTVKFSLRKNDIRRSGYVLRVIDENGIRTLPNSGCMTYVGETEAGGAVRFTIAAPFVCGMIEHNGAVYFLENSNRFDKNLADDTYVLYEEKDVAPLPNNWCAATEKAKKESELHAHSHNRSSVPVGCTQVDVAIASDFLMYQDFGSSVAAVEANNIAVMNNVNTDYDNVFAREIIFGVSEQLVSTSSSSALETALTSTTNGLTVLSNFRSWGNGGGFSGSFDLGQIWTGRNISTPNSGSGVIGIAYTGGMCGSFKYQILENFTTSAVGKRVLVSHETGHNFNASHDASGAGTIMAPSVNSTTSWSSNSINSINTHESGGACLSSTIGLAGSPIPDFALASQTCLGAPIPLVDNSQRAPTSWLWSMAGGTPSSASTATTSTSYNTAGAKSIMLTVSNAACGSSVSVSTDQSITISSQAAPMAACGIGNSNSNTNLNFGTGITNVSFNTLSYSSGSTFSEGQIYFDRVCEASTNLTATSNPISITVGNTNPEAVRVYIDYNNDGVFSASELMLNSSASTGTHSGTIVNPSGALQNVPLRMRVISDISINSACNTPTYGQIEDYGIVISGNLPVELAFFDAKMRDESVALSWMTASEYNADYFEIQRSTDNITFYPIGKMQAAGTVDVQQNYQFLDSAPMRGRNYYRLRTVDFDGSSELSDIQTVNISQDSPISVYPNPILGQVLYLSGLDSRHQESYTAQVFSITGSLLWENTIQANTPLVELNIPLLDDLAPGAYLFQVVGRNTAFTKRLMKD